MFSFAEQVSAWIKQAEVGGQAPARLSNGAVSVAFGPGGMPESMVRLAGAAPVALGGFALAVGGESQPLVADAEGAALLDGVFPVATAGAFHVKARVLTLAPVDRGRGLEGVLIGILLETASKSAVEGWLHLAAGAPLVAIDEGQERRVGDTIPFSVGPGCPVWIPLWVNLGETGTLPRSADLMRATRIHYRERLLRFRDLDGAAEVRYGAEAVCRVAGDAGAAALVSLLAAGLADENLLVEGIHASRRAQAEGWREASITLAGALYGWTDLDEAVAGADLWGSGEGFAELLREDPATWSEPPSPLARVARWAACVAASRLAGEVLEQSGVADAWARRGAEARSLLNSEALDVDAAALAAMLGLYTPDEPRLAPARGAAPYSPAGLLSFLAMDLGLHWDAPTGVLRLAPVFAPRSFRATDVRMGALHCDVEWRDEEMCTVVELKQSEVDAEAAHIVLRPQGKRRPTLAEAPADTTLTPGIPGMASMKPRIRAPFAGQHTVKVVIDWK